MAWSELHTEGLQFLLECAFSEEQVPPANFYLGLCTDASLAEDANLAALTEVSGLDYARQEIPSTAVGFTSAGTGTNDRKVTATQETFTAGGNWTTAKGWFLATSADGSGKLIASGNLAADRTLVNGDTLKVTATITLTG